MDTLFRPGSAVYHRNVAHGRARFVVASIVVSDTDGETRLLWRPGAPIKAARSFELRGDPAAYEAASRAEVATGEWEMGDAAWQETEVLVVARPADWYSIWLFWSGPERAFTGYYVNFEVPWQRNARGFDTCDLSLDLVVGPGLEYAWKDVEAFDERVAEALITAEQARGVQRARVEVLERIVARDGVFAGRDLAWQPSPAWATPSLADGWDLAP